jgi:hypothetical protein
MYKFNEFGQYHYNEASQSNPLRWQVFYREGDVFTPQTGVFMCKDYLNDVCAVYNGANVIAYGMNTKDMKLNDDGIWLRLFFIKDNKYFLDNIERCVNAENPEYPVYTEVVDNTMLMFIPRYYFNSTYLISLLAFAIRVSNNKLKFKSLDDLLTRSKDIPEKAINGHGTKLSQQWKFKVPEEYQQYWSYYNKEFNSAMEDMYTGSTIHNNGAQSWAEGIHNEQEKKAA